MVQAIISPPIALLDPTELLDVFGLFLLVLVGVELLDTVKAYLTEHVVHEEVILVAALIAVARKVIVLDVKNLPIGTLFGVAVLVLAVAVAYLIVKWTQIKSVASKQAKE